MGSPLGQDIFEFLSTGDLSCILYKFQIRLEGLSGLVPVHLDTSSDSVSGYAISE